MVAFSELGRLSVGLLAAGVAGVLFVAALPAGLCLGGLGSDVLPGAPAGARLPAPGAGVRRRLRPGRRPRPGARPRWTAARERADRRPTQLGTPAAAALADLAATFEELQTVLGCCERLVASPAPDELVAEALWTTALLSYTRCFAPARAASG